MGEAAGRKVRSKGAEQDKADRSASKGRARASGRSRPQPSVPGLSLARSGPPAVRLGSAVQRKAVVGPADEVYEDEAERVAQQVASGLEAPEVSLIGPGSPARLSGSSTQQDEALDEEGAKEAVRAGGAGRPLDPGVRTRLESAFGEDLNHVRIHDGPADREAAARIDARAFTHGSDIWLGPGESEDDLQLMAHEITHVIQQGGIGIGRVQRSSRPGSGGQGGGGRPQGGQQTGNQRGNDQSGGGGNRGSVPPTGAVEGDVITFPEIQVPAFKVADPRGKKYEGALTRNKEFSAESRRGTLQQEVWQEGVAEDTDAIESALEEKLEQAYGGVPPRDTYVFKAPSRRSKSEPVYFVGALPQIAVSLALPSWDRAGEPHSFQVDHILELQLANWPRNPEANKIGNMELLDSGVNQSSGSVIRHKVDEKVRAFIDATGGEFGTKVADVKKTYHLRFLRAVGAPIGRQPGPNDFWTLSDIVSARHLGPVEPANLAELGGDGKVVVFPASAGGWPMEFSLSDAEGQETEPTLREQYWLAPFVIKRKQFMTEGDVSSQPELGLLKVNVRENDPKWHTFASDEEVPILRVRGARYAGYINKRAVRDRLRRLRVKRLSPIRIDVFDVLPEGGVFAQGAILPETPLIGGLDLGFELSGDDFSVYKEFRAEEFNVPAPFSVSDSSLTLIISTERGFVVDGRIDFAVEGAGEGHVEAVAGAQEGLALQGVFNFDTELFDRAEIDLWYRDDAFGARGTLVIGPGKVRGIRGGRIEAEYVDGRFSAEGAVQPDIPGIEQGRMALSFSEEEGLVIGGGFTLSQDVPGVRSGSIDVTVRKEEDGWKVTAEGTARPDIPGIDTNLSVSYDDGIFSIRGSAAYERGMLRGNVDLGVNNRPIDESGRPSGEPGPDLRAFGGGDVTVRLAPWLEGTAGVRLLENGEMEISGRIGFPDAVELFEGLSYEKEILRPPPLDIPIIGVAAAGRRIGIFATIRGGLEARAGIGPGVLRDVLLGVTYNPDREEETHVTGSANLHVPATAGLRLYVQGGIGAGIPVVSATAGLEVGGELGLEGALNTGVDVDWTPVEGLKINAFGEMYVQPKFIFDIEAFVNVELDLLLQTISLYERSWELASVEFGSNLRFGLRFPVRYEEGKPFNLSLSDVEFIAPDVNVKDLIGDLVDSIV